MFLFWTSITNATGLKNELELNWIYADEDGYHLFEENLKTQRLTIVVWKNDWSVVEISYGVDHSRKYR